MDSAAAFDTLAATRALEAAGVGRPQAEAIAEVTAQAAGAGHGELATRADLARQEARIYPALASLWVAQTAAIVGVLAIMLP